MSDAWNTPAWIVELAAGFLGDIDLDPCGNDESRIPASTTYTIDEDGLVQPWHGRVYCNPPYSRPAPWLAKCEAVYLAGGHCLALIKADHSTRWWQRYVRPAPARCDLSRRVKYDSTGGATSTSATFPSSIVCWSDRVGRFAQLFAHCGEIVRSDR